MNYKIIIKLLFFPFLVYMFNSAIQSLALSFYYIYSIDTLSHFLGGMAIAFSANYALTLIEKKNWITIKKPVLRAIILVGAVMTFAVLWEFYEFTYDLLMWGDVMQPSVADTIKDLDMGMIGAIVFCVGLLYKKRTSYSGGRR